MRRKASLSQTKMKTEKRKHKRRKRRSLIERGRRFLRTRRGLQVFIECVFSMKIQFLDFVSEIFRGIDNKLHL